MAELSLLRLVQKSMVLVGLKPKPTIVIGNQEATIGDSVEQLVEFAEQTGRELVERVNWAVLDTAGTVTGTGAATLFSLPDDFMRFSPSDKSPRGALVSNKDPLDSLFGPINTEDLNRLKALPASTVRPVWRIVGRKLEIWPALANAELVTFSYFSDKWVSSADGVTTRNYFAADDDVPLLESNIVLQGMVWRFKASKGLEYAEDKLIYESALARVAGQQMTERVISTSYQIHDTDMYHGSITDLTSH